MSNCHTIWSGVLNIAVCHEEYVLYLVVRDAYTYHYNFTPLSGGIRGTVVTLANRSSDRSCTRGMILNKIHHFRPGCLGPSIALKVQNHGLKHHSFIHVIIPTLSSKVSLSLLSDIHTCTVNYSPFGQWCCIHVSSAWRQKDLCRQMKSF